MNDPHDQTKVVRKDLAKIHDRRVYLPEDSSSDTGTKCEQIGSLHSVRSYSDLTPR